MPDELFRRDLVSLPPSAVARTKLRSESRALVELLTHSGNIDVMHCRNVANELRNLREFELLDQLVEQIRLHGAQDPGLRCLQAQSLIERGKPATAIDVLEGTLANVEPGSVAWAEINGLMGRAWKQSFFTVSDKTGPAARFALNKAIERYAGPYFSNPATNIWHGVNLLALNSFARSNGLTTSIELDPEPLARTILDELLAQPESRRDGWYHASLAEAYLGLGKIAPAESHLGLYARDPNTTAFALSSTLRQLTQLWQLTVGGTREQVLLHVLTAALASKEEGHVELTGAQVQNALHREIPHRASLEAILGADGPKTYEWWRRGLTSACSVAVVWHQDIQRVGSGFLVKAGDFLPSLGEELVLLTNSHVVSDDPADSGIPPDEANIVFEAVDRNRRHVVTQVLWRSPPHLLDSALLRFQSPPEGAQPLPLTLRLPTLDGSQRVYVIGHPGGGELAFSFQDNLLLDHEGPPDGSPPDPDVARVQYRAPTEGGSSGSPVFNAHAWQVVALHHAGGDNMNMLNGKTGQWAANEGIWIKSIVDAARCGDARSTGPSAVPKS